MKSIDVNASGLFSAKRCLQETQEVEMVLIAWPRTFQGLALSLLGFLVSSLADFGSRQTCRRVRGTRQNRFHSRQNHQIQFGEN